MALGNKEIFSQNLKYYMYKYGVDRNALCDTLGFKYMTVSDWINAKTYPRIDKIEILANYFNIKKSDLVEKQTDKQIDILPVYNQLADIRKHKVYSYAQQQLDEQNSNLNEHRSIYLVGSSAAGLPLDYGDLDAELIDLSNIPAKADKAIHIKGDSMEPKIANNSIIFYHEQPTLEIGEIGIFEINGSAVTCKKYYVDYESKKIVLKSINPKYEPMYFNGEQVRILGKVVF
ncbi:LexA family transcriptional regulator [Lactobacillus iners]|uniref:LexA family transcriptional regulator n=1 Tax=Lactobacillus iners TaxID=147802 RepID=UPI00136E08B5|nr:XRE family transcriptional regulator [Lactobacillus iners]MYM99664.1 helix-turn-helix domain-containing protein [Lactobacillus iners]